MNENDGELGYRSIFLAFVNIILLIYAILLLRMPSRRFPRTTNITSFPLELKTLITNHVKIEDQLKFLQMNKAIRQFILLKGPFPKVIQNFSITSENDVLYQGRIYGETIKIEINEQRFNSNGCTKTGILYHPLIAALFDKIHYCQDFHLYLAISHMSEYSNFEYYLDVSKFLPDLRVAKRLYVHLDKNNYVKILAKKWPSISVSRIHFQSPVNGRYDKTYVKRARGERIEFLKCFGMKSDELFLDIEADMAFEAFRQTKVPYIHCELASHRDRDDLDLNFLTQFIESGIPSVNPDAELLVTVNRHLRPPIDELLNHKRPILIDTQSNIGDLIVQQINRRLETVPAVELMARPVITENLTIFELHPFAILNCYVAVDKGILFLKNLSVR